LTGEETASRERRNALIEQYELLEAKLAATGLTDQEMDEVEADWERTKLEYFSGLPRVRMSRCPFCRELFRHSFDPWGVDGYWWQETELVTVEEPSTCEHFTVLQGAVSLEGRPPVGGRREESRIGPAVPFVLPRLLERPRTVAVISSLRMECGYVAYPITYFCEGGASPADLTNAWRRRSFEWVTPDGDPAWSVKNDRWDFGLAPWIEKDTVLWIKPDDDRMRLLGRDAGSCPYVGLPGVREQQVVLGDQVFTVGVPEDEDPAPFSEE
jgi:hypothetical protein